MTNHAKDAAEIARDIARYTAEGILEDITSRGGMDALNEPWAERIEAIEIQELRQ